MPHMSFENGDSDEARQFLLDQRCMRMHPKRHRTLKRAKGISAKKRMKVKHRLAMQDKELAKYKDAVRLYWAGLADHP